MRGYRHGGRHYSVGAARVGADHWRVHLDGEEHDVTASAVDAATLRITVRGRSHVVRLTRIGDAEHVACDGAVYVLTPEHAGSHAAEHPVTLAAPQITAPMPGKVLQVLVRAGQEVAAGDGLLILEAMKMEHRMSAEAAAVVRAVHVGDGDMVDAGAVLVELEYAE
jgi:biotin carboxyl carrier protein